MEAFLQDDLLFRYRQHPYFRGKDHIAVRSDIVSGRAKAVSVQYRSHYVSVREQNRRRTVPGFHHCSVILIKISFFLGNGIVVGPGLRNGDHHRQRQIHAAHHKKFQSIVKHRGVGTAPVDYGKDFMKLPLQIRRFHIFFPCQHFVRVSPDRIDLAVVNDKTVRMRSLPAWIGIGAEPGVYHGNG